MRILILHGPNLQLLGSREPDVYGTRTLAEIDRSLQDQAVELGVEVTCVQSNAEGELVTLIGEATGRYEGILINPAAYTHTSVALRDALAACGLPAVEVHLSNTAGREDFRHRSVTAGACLGQVLGFGALGYNLALGGLVSILNKNKE